MVLVATDKYEMARQKATATIEKRLKEWGFIEEGQEETTKSPLYRHLYGNSFGPVSTAIDVTKRNEFDALTKMHNIEEPDISFIDQPGAARELNERWRVDKNNPETIKEVSSLVAELVRAGGREALKIIISNTKPLNGVGGRST